MAIRQITIIGTGLIGGSLGLALTQERKFAGRIVGCDREAMLEKARDRGAIDAGIADPGGCGAWQPGGCAGRAGTARFST